MSGDLTSKGDFSIFPKRVIAIIAYLEGSCQPGANHPSASLPFLQVWGGLGDWHPVIDIQLWVSRTLRIWLDWMSISAAWSQVQRLAKIWLMIDNVNGVDEMMYIDV